MALKITQCVVQWNFLARRPFKMCSRLAACLRDVDLVSNYWSQWLILHLNVMILAHYRGSLRHKCACSHRKICASLGGQKYVHLQACAKLYST